jgi:hypothetical protein
MGPAAEPGRWVNHRGPIGGPGEGGLATRNFENSLGVAMEYLSLSPSLSLSVGALLGEPGEGGGAPLLGALKFMKGRI